MRITRAIQIDVDVYEMINGIVAFAEDATKPVICPVFWERLRQAADMLEEEYNNHGKPFPAPPPQKQVRGTKV